jgi:phosphoserine phosphatase RsbU/P
VTACCGFELDGESGSFRCCMADAQIDAGEWEIVELRALVGHAHSVPATATVETTLAAFARHGIEFIAVQEAGRLLGVCARRELTESLGSRFGFALNASRPVVEHLMAEPLRIETGSDLTEVFKAVAARSEREFYDDVLLVEWDNRYVGLIPMRTLARLQTELLLGNIARVEESRREIATKNRQMEDDLCMAREVQLAMLPSAQPPLTWADKTLQVASRFQAAGDMSGDFFSTLRLSDQRLGVLVCDVMGHGVRSALITAMVRAMLEGLRPIADDPALLLTHLNRDLTRLLRQAGGLIFVTAAYAVFDLAGEKLRYAQAGHPTPLRWDARIQAMRTIACTDEQAGPALGIMDDFEFVCGEEALAPGDRILLFTDGLTEAATTEGRNLASRALRRRWRVAPANRSTAGSTGCSTR